MSVKRGKFVEIFTPTDLGLVDVDTSLVQNNPGSFVDIRRYDSFLLIALFSNANVGGHIRYRAKLASGVDTPPIPLRGASAYPFALGSIIAISCGRSGGVFMNVDATLPSLTSSFAGCDQVAFDLQVTTGQAGSTANFHLFAKTVDVR